MRRGDIHMVDLEPARGGEADRRRPAVIVSNDGADESVERVRQRVGSVPRQHMAELATALRRHLAL
ncbi:type II toxin-antitoxin system PemK/MazF family toxin [Streptomyces sp. NBC_01506]|uniref:type II toxin-antitoxin system PemK/MazF family toxin n=1 Tax=Streptomyces sp. NBC_01506 TaxID=2903887 RepID=UPI0038631D5D